MQRDMAVRVFCGTLSPVARREDVDTRPKQIHSLWHTAEDSLRACVGRPMILRACHSLPSCLVITPTISHKPRTERANAQLPLQEFWHSRRHTMPQ